MKVINVHERVLQASMTEIGRLIDELASPNDRLWPHDQWPAMKFDRPLSVGAVGGHGPIRYTVERYQPGQSIQFRFTQPKNFLGSHGFEIEMVEGEKTRLRHIIEMQVPGIAWLSWHFVIRPLHDALIEDALDQAELYIGGRPAQRNWSGWVRFLRRVMSRRRSSKN